MRLKNIVILGAGAVGILPAVKLREVLDIFVTVTADVPRICRYRRDGIFFNDKLIPFMYASDDELNFCADLVIIAVKMPSLREALPVVRKCVNQNTVILPLLNGINASEIIAEYYPEANILKGFFLGHASVRERNRIYHDGVGTFYCGGDNEAVNSVAELFRFAGINIEIPADMSSAMWKKFVLNVGINQTQAVFTADYGKVQQEKSLQDFCRELMKEAVSVAEAENVCGTEDMVDNAMQVIMQMPGDVKTSMLQDVLAGRITEVEAFAGTICAKAEKYNIPVPYNREALDKISGMKHNAGR